ncbi:MAG: hypothetical protein KAH32_08190 [Chlamydiia bacterium]|nr:hypothetical protein [Chlamydiia bacterium]
MKKLILVVALLLIGFTGYSQMEYKCYKFVEYNENTDGGYDSEDAVYKKRTFAFYDGDVDYTISSKLFIRDDEISGTYVWSRNDPDNKNAVGHWYIDRMTKSGNIFIYIAGAGEYPYAYISDDYINYWYKEGAYYRYYFTE